MKNMLKVAGTLLLGGFVALMIDGYLVDLNHHTSSLLSNALPLLYMPTSGAWAGFALLSAVLYAYAGYTKWLLLAVVDPKGQGCPVEMARTGRTILTPAERNAILVVCLTFVLFWPLFLLFGHMDTLIDEAPGPTMGPRPTMWPV